MSKRDRRDGDGRDRDRRDMGRDRDRDWEDEGQQRRSGEGEILEGDSLTALKAILSKVATQLKPLNLSADESIRLVEQLYGRVLDMDSALAGEADDTRKSSTLAYLQNTAIRREGDRVVVDFPTPEDLRAAEAAKAAPGAETAAAAAPPAPAAPQPQRPPQTAPAQASPAQAARTAEAPAPAPFGEAPARPPRAARPRQAPKNDNPEAAPRSGATASDQEAGDMQRQQPRIDPADRGQAERPEPEGPEA